jgi:hypothetical protein
MMEREVLPARRAFNWKAMLLAGLISGCAAHAITAPPPRVHLNPGVPMSVWTIDLRHSSYRCEPMWLQPATWCNRRDQHLTYDGCRWRCKQVNADEEKM